MAASGSFRAPSFHAGPESGVTISKKIEKMQNLRVTSFYMTYKREKNSKLQKNCLPSTRCRPGKYRRVDRAGAAG
jgi:hypothetical protein